MQGFLLIGLGVAHLLWDVLRFLWHLSRLIGNTAGLIVDLLVLRLSRWDHWLVQKRDAVDASMKEIEHGKQEKEVPGHGTTEPPLR